MKKLFTRLFDLVKSEFDFILITIILALIYSPLLSMPAAIHNDYSMIWNVKNALGWVESTHLLIVGRPLNALMVNIPFCNIHEFTDFTFWRWVEFSIMIITLGLLSFFLRWKWQWPKPWVTLLIFSIGILPSSTVFITWVSNLPPGFPTIFVSLLAYIIFSWGRDSQSSCPLTRIVTGSAMALIVFVIALLIYPPSAMFFLALTFVHLLYSENLSAVKLRTMLIQDLVFAGFGMGLYWGLERSIFHPLAVAFAHGYIPPQPEYQMAIGINLPVKLRLLWDTLTTGTAGTWYIAFLSWGALIWAIGIIIFAALTWFLRTRSLPDNAAADQNVREMPLWEKIGWGILLMLVANAPTLLPVGCIKLIGYRVVFITAFMGLFLFFRLAQTASSALNKRGFPDVILGLVIVTILLNGILATKTYTTMSHNYIREYDYIQTKILECNPRTTRYYVMVPLPQGELLVPGKLPLDFNLMVAANWGFMPFADKYLGGRPILKGTSASLMKPEDADQMPASADVCKIDLRQSPFWGNRNKNTSKGWMTFDDSDLRFMRVRR